MGLGNMNSAAATRGFRPSSLPVPGTGQVLNGGGGEARCQCCPYGFHIDLDFVRFCESVATGSELRQKREERRARRLQCNSMEVLLGFAAPSYASFTAALPTITDRESSVTPQPDLLSQSNNSGELEQAVDDFEATLSMSSSHSSHVSCTVDLLSTACSASNNNQREWFAPKLRHPSQFPDEGDSFQEVDSRALQVVRSQMAASLEKLQQLEQQVKLIPVLQVRVSVLQEEKRKLSQQLLDLRSKLVEASTRPETCTVGTSTAGKQSQDVMSQTKELEVTTKQVQTLLGELAEICVQTEPEEQPIIEVPPSVLTVENWVQTEQPVSHAIEIQLQAGLEIAVPVENMETNATHTATELMFIQEADPVVTTTPPARQLSDNCSQTCDKILQLPLATSETQTWSAAVESANQTDPAAELSDGETQTHQFATMEACIQTQPGERSSRQCQTDPGPQRADARIQTDPNVPSSKREVQSAPALPQLLLQRRPLKKSIAVGDGAVGDLLCDRCANRRTRHVACSTDVIRHIGVHVSTQCLTPCAECKQRSMAAKQMVDRNCQTLEMKFRDAAVTARLDADDVRSTVTHAAGGDKEEEPKEELLDDEDDDEEVADDDTGREGDDEDQEEEESEAAEEEEDDGEEEEEEFDDAGDKEEEEERVRVEPSNEMKAALKVLNDSIQRPQRAHSKALVNAIEIVRREWIQVSSTKDADANAVDDYMDYLESLSMEVLERVANMTDNNGNTALHYAVSHSQWDIVSLLLDSKVCYPQLRNKAGYSPPMLAALAQPVNSTELQVLHRLFSLADVNAKATQHGQTALMLAVSHGRVEVVRLLLASGADVNVQDADGSTALMCAAEHGHTAIVKLLLAQADIDLHLTDNDSSTALSIAMEAGHKDIGLLIYAHLNFQRSNSSSATSSPVRNASPMLLRKTCI